MCDTNAKCCRLTSEDLMAASREIWEEAEQAIGAVAILRGWPHENDDDVAETVRRLNLENPGLDLPISTEFHSALLFQANVRYEFMDQSELEGFRPLVKKFVKHLEAL